MLNKIKLFFMDLDGTLISKKWVSKENIVACQKLQAFGVKIIITTGRDFNSSYPIVELLGIEKQNGYLICLNGAKIYSLETLQPIYEQPIDNKISEELINFLAGKRWNVGAYKNKEMFVMKTNYISSRIQAHLKTKIKIAKTYHEISQDTYKIFCYWKWALFFPKTMNKKASDLESKFSSKLEITKSSLFSYELVSKNVSKGAAVEFVAKRLNFTTENIAVIGDSFNDVSMFKVAGYSIAMSNGINELISISDYTTMPNFKNGVAHAINTQILK